MNTRPLHDRSDIRCSGWVSMSSSVYGTRIRDIQMTLKQIMCCMHKLYYHFRFPRVILPTGCVPSVLPRFCLQLFPRPERPVTPSRPTPDKGALKRVLVTKEVFNEKCLVFCVFLYLYLYTVGRICNGPSLSWSELVMVRDVMKSFMHRLGVNT